MKLNKSGIRPQAYKVLVEPKETETKTKGGLLLPDDTVEKEQFGRQEGILVAVSPMAFTFDGDWPADREDEKPAIGDRVFFSRYQAMEITGRDGGKYWIMEDRSIAGVMTDE